MKTALCTGTLGLILSLFVGTKLLDLNSWEVGLCFVVSNLAFAVALLTTLQAERNLWIKQHVIQGNIRTWSLCCLIYFTLLFTLSFPLWHPKNFLYLIFPLFLSSGFGILLFGPLQDAVVRRAQKAPRRSQQLRKNRLVRS